MECALIWRDRWPVWSLRFPKCHINSRALTWIHCVLKEKTLPKLPQRNAVVHPEERPVYIFTGVIFLVQWLPEVSSSAPGSKFLHINPHPCLDHLAISVLFPLQILLTNLYIDGSRFVWCVFTNDQFLARVLRRRHLGCLPLLQRWSVHTFHAPCRCTTLMAVISTQTEWQISLRWRISTGNTIPSSGRTRNFIKPDKACSWCDGGGLWHLCLW